MFIPDPNFLHPGFEFFPSRIRIFPFRIPDPRSKKFPVPGSTFISKRCLSRIWIFSILDRYRIRIKEFKYFHPKNCLQALGNMIQNVHRGSRSWSFTHLRSRIQESKRHRIQDPQHWFCESGSGFHWSRIQNGKKDLNKSKILKFHVWKAGPSGGLLFSTEIPFMEIKKALFDNSIKIFSTLNFGKKLGSVDTIRINWIRICTYPGAEAVSGRINKALR